MGDVHQADATDTVAEPADPEEEGQADGPALPPYRLDHLLLLDSAGNDPLEIESLIFGDDGVGVVRRRGEQPRLLPWSSVSAHAVERWSGGIVPEWWVDPELNRTEPGPGQGPVLTDPDATSRAMPHIEPGALIGIKTPTRTYRFLLPAGDPKTIAPRIAAFAVRQQGPAGASSVTTVVRPGTGQSADGRTGTPPFALVEDPARPRRAARRAHRNRGHAHPAAERGDHPPAVPRRRELRPAGAGQNSVIAATRCRSSRCSSVAVADSSARSSDIEPAALRRPRM